MANPISQQTQQQIQSLSPDAYQRLSDALNRFAGGRGLAYLHGPDEFQLAQQVIRETGMDVSKDIYSGRAGATQSWQTARAYGFSSPSEMGGAMKQYGATPPVVQLPVATPTSTPAPSLIEQVQRFGDSRLIYTPPPIQQSMAPSNQDVMMGQTTVGGVSYNVYQSPSGQTFLGGYATGPVNTFQIGGVQPTAFGAPIRLASQAQAIVQETIRAGGKLFLGSSAPYAEEFIKRTGKEIATKGPEKYLFGRTTAEVERDYSLISQSDIIIKNFEDKWSNKIFNGNWIGTEQEYNQFQNEQANVQPIIQAGEEAYNRLISTEQQGVIPPIVSGIEATMQRIKGTNKEEEALKEKYPDVDFATGSYLYGPRTVRQVIGMAGEEFVTKPITSSVMGFAPQVRVSREYALKSGETTFLGIPGATLQKPEAAKFLSYVEPVTLGAINLGATFIPAVKFLRLRSAVKELERTPWESLVKSSKIYEGEGYGIISYATKRRTKRFEQEFINPVQIYNVRKDGGVIFDEPTTFIPFKPRIITRDLKKGTETIDFIKVTGRTGATKSGTQTLFGKFDRRGVLAQIGTEGAIKKVVAKQSIPEITLGNIATARESQIVMGRKVLIPSAEGLSLTRKIKGKIFNEEFLRPYQKTYTFSKTSKNYLKILESGTRSFITKGERYVKTGERKFRIKPTVKVTKYRDLLAPTGKLRRVKISSIGKVKESGDFITVSVKSKPFKPFTTTQPDVLQSLSLEAPRTIQISKPITTLKIIPKQVPMPTTKQLAVQVSKRPLYTGIGESEFAGQGTYELYKTEASVFTPPKQMSIQFIEPATTKQSLIDRQILEPINRQIMEPISRQVITSDQVLIPRQVIIPRQIMIPRQALVPRQMLVPRQIQVPQQVPRIVPKIGIPIIPILTKTKSKLLAGKPIKSTELSYLVYTRKAKKPMLVSTKPLLRGEALALGVRATKTTARASFQLIPTKAKATSLGLAPITEKQVYGFGFRPPIKKGKTGARDTFIQLRSTRLGTRAEVRAVQSYKRRSGIW